MRRTAPRRPLLDPRAPQVLGSPRSPHPASIDDPAGSAGNIRRPRQADVETTERQFFSAGDMDQATLSAQNEAYEEVRRLQEKLASLKARRDATAMEMADSDRFLLSLEEKLTALGDAVLPAGTADMRDVLGFMA